MPRSFERPAIAIASLALSLAFPLAIGGFSSQSFAQRATGSAQETTAESDEFPAEWFWDIKGSAARFRPMLGRPAPALHAKRWIGEPQDLSKLIGKVVVVDFWGTWCGTCVSSLPELNTLAEERAKDGVVVIGVHDTTRGVENLDKMVKSKGLSYPQCVDDADASGKAYRVSFKPTIAIIDRAGKLRAIGVKPEHVAAIVKELVSERAPEAMEKPSPTPPAPAAPRVQGEGGMTIPGAMPLTASTHAAMLAIPLQNAPSQPASPASEAPKVKDPPAARQPPAKDAPSDPHAAFGEGNSVRRRAVAAIAKDGVPPPIASPEWINSDAISLSDLKGKVVVLDFWATWCGPCLQGIPHMNKLAEKYKDRVVIIGVCHPRGAEQMASVAKDRGIAYPICRLTDETVLRAYAVDSYPDYYLIDKDGTLAIRDCANQHLEAAIEALLK